MRFRHRVFFTRHESQCSIRTITESVFFFFKNIFNSQEVARSTINWRVIGRRVNCNFFFFYEDSRTSFSAILWPSGFFSARSNIVLTIVRVGLLKPRLAISARTIEKNPKRRCVYITSTKYEIVSSCQRNGAPYNVSKSVLRRRKKSFPPPVVVVLPRRETDCILFLFFFVHSSRTLRRFLTKHSKDNARPLSKKKPTTAMVVNFTLCVTIFNFKLIVKITFFFFFHFKYLTQFFFTIKIFY